MKRTLWFAICWGACATFELAGAPLVSIDTVLVGNAGNASYVYDPAKSGVTNVGAVAYDYRIGSYEVTNSEYTVFLNAIDPNGTNPNSVYNSTMGSATRGGISFNAGAAAGSKYSVRSNMGDKPVNYVSYYDALRFTNWLHNGATTSSSTETGAYTLTGASSPTALVSQNSGALFWLPTRDEWMKAAYYDPTLNSGSGGYWSFATASNSTPSTVTADVDGDGSSGGTGNTANFNGGANWNSSTGGNVTTVGTNGGSSYYGTFDQNGNVGEWVQASASSGNAYVMGASYDNNVGVYGLNGNAALGANDNADRSTRDFYGFRIATVPEPGTVPLVLGAAGLIYLIFRRRRLQRSA